jgi:trans-aconitate methyltransferase
MNTKKLQDDYEWPVYTEIYANQTKGMFNGQNDENEKYDFVIKKSYFDGEKIVFLDNFHGNFMDIYQKISESNVSSVIECGCGPGHHLYNIKTLFPNVEVFGVELLETQCQYGYCDLKIPAEFYEKIVIGDFSIPNISDRFDKKYDFVFTNAVVQHLNHDKALNFIRNMGKISNKYIMMKENLRNHNYESLFNESGILNEFNLQVNQGNLCPSIFLIKK